MTQLSTVAAHKINLSTLTNTAVTGQPVIVTYFHGRMGVYIPCSFDEDGNPNWQGIKDTIRAQEYVKPGVTDGK